MTETTANLAVAVLASSGTGSTRAGCCGWAGGGLRGHGELELPHGEGRRGGLLRRRRRCWRGGGRGRGTRRGGAVPGADAVGGVGAAVPPDVGHVLHVRREPDHHLPLFLSLVVVVLVDGEDLGQVLEAPEKPRHQRLPLGLPRAARRPIAATYTHQLIEEKEEEEEEKPLHTHLGASWLAGSRRRRRWSRSGSWRRG